MSKSIEWNDLRRMIRDNDLISNEFIKKLKLLLTKQNLLNIDYNENLVDLLVCAITNVMYGIITGEKTELKNVIDLGKYPLTLRIK